MTASEPMTREQFDAIRERVDATTEGPWERCGRGINGGPSSLTEVVTLDVECMGYCYGGTGLGVQNEADAEFIAHARQDVPALLAEVEALRPRAALADAMIERVARDTAAKESRLTGNRRWEDMPEDEQAHRRAGAQHALAADLDPRRAP